MATAQANAAAPLDQLLVDVGAGPLRRWLPGRPGVEFIASLASKPCKVGRRLSIMVGDRTLLLAACSGSIITSMLLGHPAVRGRLNRIAGLGLLVTVLDQAKAGLPAACVSKAMLCRAAASSVRKGYLDGPTLAELFASRRPGDLIWNYWVNNKAEAQRIRSLNKQVLARASAARTGAVDGYEKALQDMADFETKIASSSQLDWLQAAAHSHTKFVTDLVSMYANAIRNGLPG